jgi:hypothetical protein
VIAACSGLDEREERHDESLTMPHHAVVSRSTD